MFTFTENAAILPLPGRKSQTQAWQHDNHLFYIKRFAIFNDLLRHFVLALPPAGMPRPPRVKFWSQIDSFIWFMTTYKLQSFTKHDESTDGKTSK